MREPTQRDLETWARACASGDAGAWARLQSRLEGALRRLFIERCGKHDLAEDLTQRALTGLWDALRGGRYDPARSALTTFAYAVAGKVWLQHLRANGRREAALERYTRLVAPTKDADSPLDERAHAALLQVVRDILRDDEESTGPARHPGCALSDEERWLMRCWAGGESDRQIARRLGIAASNVNARKQAVYRKIRERLRDAGYERWS
jgi:RNA polymerase sigma factor (sigma-70 family)